VLCIGVVVDATATAAVEEETALLPPTVVLAVTHRINDDLSMTDRKTNAVDMNMIICCVYIFELNVIESSVDWGQAHQRMMLRRFAFDKYSND